MTLRLALAGKEASADTILGAPRLTGLTCGVLKDRIVDLVDPEVCDNLLIAKGVPPEGGKRPGGTGGRDRNPMGTS